MDTIADRLRMILVGQIGCDPEDVTDTSTLADMGVDSLDVIDIVIAAEAEFEAEFPDDGIGLDMTFAQLVRVIEAAIKSEGP